MRINMKKTLTIILLLAIFMPMVNAQSNKVLFYLKTDVKPDAESKAVAVPESTTNDGSSEDDVVFVIVESMPEFPGGQQALFKYLSENVKYPVIAQENGIQGRVVCQFVVNKDGSIDDIEVVRSGGDPSLDKEAIRVIKSMPKWKPGKQRGKAVRVKYSVPVTFSLN